LSGKGTNARKSETLKLAKEARLLSSSRVRFHLAVIPNFFSKKTSRLAVARAGPGGVPDPRAPGRPSDGKRQDLDSSFAAWCRWAREEAGQLELGMSSDHTRFDFVFFR